MKNGKFIWMNGSFVTWDDARVHVLTHGLHYGTGIYEGMRCYKTSQGPGIFRPKEHYERLLEGAQAIRLKIDYEIEQLLEITREVVRKNEFEECYIRPIAYFSSGSRGLDIRNTTTEIAIAAWEWGAYLGEKGLHEGIKCKIANIKRIDRSSMPAGTKVCGNYVNSVLGKIEAIDAGYDESILLTSNDTVAECTGENIFIVKNGEIVTPSVDAGIVPGITRESIIELGKNLGFTISERTIEVGELFEADEMFLTGTAAEVTPVRQVNDSIITEEPGAITKKIQGEFFEIVRGKRSEYMKWIYFVDK